MIAHQRRQQVIEAVMILGHFLILQREHQHRFFAQPQMRGRREIRPSGGFSMEI